MSTTVVLVAGPAGSGKTTSSRILARHLRAAHLDKDSVTRRFVEAMLNERGLPEGDRESLYYQDVCRPLEYDTLIATAVDVAASGCPVVIDAPFGIQLSSVDWWNWFTNTLEAVEAYPVLVLLSTPSAEWKMRVQARGAVRDTGKLADWEAFAASVSPIAEGIPTVHLSNSGTTADLESQLATLAASI